MSWTQYFQFRNDFGNAKLLRASKTTVQVKWSIFPAFSDHSQVLNCEPLQKYVCADQSVSALHVL